MKLIPNWKWENIWLVFIVTSCLVGPFAIVAATVPNFAQLFSQAPKGAVVAALAFGFAWGFGAILFGRSVERLGVSVANTLVIGVSSALGSLVPLMLGGKLSFDRSQILLFSAYRFLSRSVDLRNRQPPQGTRNRSILGRTLDRLCYRGRRWNHVGSLQYRLWPRFTDCNRWPFNRGFVSSMEFFRSWLSRSAIVLLCFSFCEKLAHRVKLFIPLKLRLRRGRRGSRNWGSASAVRFVDGKTRV